MNGPLGEPAPGVRLTRGLNRTKRTTTSRAVPQPFSSRRGIPRGHTTAVTRRPARPASMTSANDRSHSLPGPPGHQPAKARGGQRGSARRSRAQAAACQLPGFSRRYGAAAAIPGA